MEDREDPWLGGNREAPWQRKRRISNYVGALVLVVLVATIGIYKGVEWMGARGKVNETKKTLQRLCKGFAKNDKAVIAEWASGSVKDAWGNQIILHSDDRTRIVFVSKGPDGVLNTPDDIGSEQVRPSAKTETQAALNANNDPNINRNLAADVQNRIEGAVDEVKKAADSGEAKAESGGWKWSLRWGRKKEGD